MLKESVKMSWQNIIHNKMRSFLTTLGIVIGVTAIIALITIVQGVTGEVTSQFTALGAGKVTISAPGTPLKAGLGQGDIEKLSAIENTQGVSPTVQMQTSAVRGGTVLENVSIEGKNQVYFEHTEKLVRTGRVLNLLDMEGQNRVCLIDSAMEKALFYGESAVGKEVALGGKTFTVVGVLGDDSIDIMASLQGGSYDGRAIIPYTTAMRMTGAKTVTSLDLFVADSKQTDQVIEEATVILEQAFNYKENSYQIINMESLLDTMNKMTGMMTTMLAGIASIALLVGGIGIMNMMLVSVTERTGEIGLRKALGAEPRRIQLQFLMESIFLSLMGGLVGLGLGLGISAIVCVKLGIAFVLSPSAIGLGVGFSAAVGILFGWAPARKASRLNPIDALRSM